jgi:hypothetical protein
MVNTVATPIVMPIVVKAVCSLLRDSALNAIPRLEPMKPYCCRRQHSPTANAAVVKWWKRFDRLEGAMRAVFGDLGSCVIGHGDAAVLFKPLEDVHH